MHITKAIETNDTHKKRKGHKVKITKHMNGLLYFVLCVCVLGNIRITIDNDRDVASSSSKQVSKDQKEENHNFNTMRLV